MINLLPDATKQQIRAARANTALIRYVFFLVFAILFLGMACAASYFYLENIKASAEKANATITQGGSDTSPTGKYNKLKQDVALAKTILDQQISYSKIITELASILPTGSILESPLSLKNETIGTPINLKIYVKSSSDEPSLKANFQRSAIFTNYSLQSIANNPNSSSEYPSLINVSVTIDRSAIK